MPSFLHGKGGKLIEYNVEVRGGNLEKAMRVLKKKVQKEGIVKEIKRRQYYMKPSEVKERRKKKALKIIRKRWAKLQKEL